MQGPIIVFDHIKGTVIVAQTNASSNRDVQEARNAQGKQLTTASGLPPR